MNLFLKKTIFVLPFLVCYGFFLYILNPIIVQGMDIFGFDGGLLGVTIMVSALMVLAGLFFAIFAALANSWTYVLPVATVSMVLPILLLPGHVGWMMSIGGMLAQVISYTFLQQRLKNYLSFRVNEVIYPAVKHFVLVVTIVSAVIYYWNTSLMIQTQGIQLPDSLIEAAINLSGASDVVEPSPLNNVPISPGQIEMLRQNPALLEQAGLDPAILDQLEQDGATLADAQRELIKSTIQTQFQRVLQPYQPIIPVVLALLFFFGIATFTALISLIGMILMWLIFLMLESTKFVSYEKEMREVKKLIV